MAKIRNGFISNSSSSSFIISKEGLTDKQINAIMNHTRYTQNQKRKNIKNWARIQFSGDENMWKVIFENDKIKMHTLMDSFDMESFLELIKVPKKNIIQYMNNEDYNAYWETI
jgi:hypothetical protein